MSAFGSSPHRSAASARRRGAPHAEHDGLSPAQRAAVTHRGGPLLIVGGAGSGKTRTLVARLAWLVEQGEAPESLLTLAPSERSADALRRMVEEAVERSYEELAVTTLEGFCARLLREEALAAAHDPFAVAVGRADRLAMLLERIDELTIRRHDFRGNPAALVASFVRRIDRLKEELIGAEEYATWAAGLGVEEGASDAERARGAREREFAEVYRAHDRMLAEQGALDSGDLVIGALRLLRDHPHVRARVAARYRHLLVDDVQEPNFAHGLLLRLLASEHGNLTAAGDDDQAIHRFRAAAAKNLRDFHAELPDATVVRLEHSFRCPQRVLDAACAVVAPLEDRIEKRLDGPLGGEVAFWRAANERAQAQAVAAEVERLIGREDVPPERIAVLVRSIAREGQAVAVALEERAVGHRLVGEAAFFQRAEVRDLLAWLRLLIDPADAPAVVRALARPPIELRSVDLARCTQIARRRKLDMVGALAAALESPQIPPEARDRIRMFLSLYRSAVGALDTMRPDLYVHRLIERLGLRRQQLFTAQAEVVERLRGLARFGELASAFVQRQPQATPREFARSIAAAAEAGLREQEEPPPAVLRGVQVMAMHAAQGLEFDHVFVLGLHAAGMPGAHARTLEPIAPELMKERLEVDDREAHVAEMRRLLHVAMTRARRRLVLVHPQASDRGAAQPPSPFAEEARAAVGGVWEERAEELFGPAESLHSTYRILRDELLETIKRTGTRIGELRFDTDLDVSHAIVRYLEVVKLAALIERAQDQPVADALAEVNARLASAITSEQRDILASSPLDDWLLDAEADDRRRAAAIAAREEPSLEPFLPLRNEGVMLSASDIDTYRTCPLKYKFARVFRIPQEPTLNQRFGILVHQVLERFHAQGGAQTLSEMMGLLEFGWRRGGFGGSEQEIQLRGKATAALTRYHERFQEEPAQPVAFERAFSFRLGPHLLRGRVDRVDKLPEGGFELIDYKTGPPRSAAQLENDVQLSLYSVAAREAWELNAARGAYYYVLDDAKVPVERADDARDWIEEIATEVAEGILSQGFEPTPSFAACGICDYRLVCPAAER
ncbi:UvrD-helicase domain-containing protein [Conexibacter arvalis]|uniref:DNA 3'-5' helicase n=1 Tax=Conexibacter arvalis TaxID=912552 RepID=A0A840IA90_9ACTN|nr:DNA helicase-2/ATP-dependent DNA helicase PcrA [Conexibacter arvalis]